MINDANYYLYLILHCKTILNEVPAAFMHTTKRNTNVVVVLKSPFWKTCQQQLRPSCHWAHQHHRA